MEIRRLTTRGLTVLAAVTAVSLGAAAPALADHGGTHVNFEITGGALSISQPATAGLGSAGTGASSLAATLGQITVTDNRGANLGSYAASVIGSAFTTGSGASVYTIPATGVSYAPPAIIGGTGTAVRVAGTAGSIATSRTAMTATGVVGNNTSVWNPTLTVTLPADAVAGAYSGTVTHSVA